MRVEDPAATLVGGAAERGELGLVHPPIVALADGATVAVEALVRWRHPRLGPLGRDRAVVRTLVELGAEAGVPVTAVGVETADEAAALLDMGCAQGQGWLFGRPGPLG